MAWVRAVLVRARSELRARLPSMLALAILLGLSAGAVMTMAAGGRRTDSAYGRFSRAFKAADVQVAPSFGVQFASLDFSKVARLPQVFVSATQHYLGAAEQDFEVVAGDAAYGTTVDRFKVLEGRMPRFASVDEAAISFSLAKSRHLHVGSLLLVHFGITGREDLPVTLHVVGIEASPGEFPPQLAGSTLGQAGAVHVGDGLYQSLKKKSVFTFDLLLLRLRRGSADIPALNNELNRLANGKPQLHLNLAAQAGNVQRSIHLQAVALWIVSGLVAVIGLLVLSQLLARQATIDATESSTLLALGMTRSQIWLTGMGRSAIIGIVGATVGVVGAFTASSLMPIGTAHIADPSSGVSFDPAVLGVGAAAAVVVALALAAWPIWKSAKVMRRVSAAAGSAKPSLAARSATLTGFPPAVSTGLRLAFESGRGRTEVPVRSSLMSVTLAIAALASALTFGAGLDHLLNTPRLYGWNWDAHVKTSSGQPSADPAVDVLQLDPAVEDLAGVATPPVLLDQRIQFDVIAFDQKKGLIDPIVIDGRAPRAPNEVALGVKTLRDAHAHIGSTVQLSITAIHGVQTAYTVVGTVIIPPNSDTARLGSGGVLTYDGVKRMVPPGFKHLPRQTNLYFRFAPGVNKSQEMARVAALPVVSVSGSGMTALENDYQIILPQRPTDLVNFGQVQNLPLLLAGLVAVLAAATLAHTLVTSIRRRRRDLAILKMLGFVPAQVRWAVTWQATTFVSAALLIGLPVGIAVGRVIWTVFAHQLGTPAEPVTPSLRLLLTIPAAVVLANLIAVIPAVMAGRMTPAPALRAE